MWDEGIKFLSKDKYIGPIIEKHGPCEIEKRPKDKYFVSLVRAISGQQLSVKAASTIFSRVEDYLGSITPESVLRADDDKLRECGLSYPKIKYLNDLASKVEEGSVEIKSFDKLSDEKVIEELVSVKGIGVWTAQMFLMFTLARQDIFPVLDLGIRKSLTKNIGEMTNEEMENFAKRWSPYRTLASWYLWQDLDNAPK